MPRILNDGTRLIDIDFGPVGSVLLRNAQETTPSSAAYSLNGQSQIVYEAPVGGVLGGAGSFVQYSRIDLEFMAKNNEVFVPVNVSVQRTSPTPTGFNQNGNITDQIEEFVFVLSRPLNVESMDNFGDFEAFRDLGLDRSNPLVFNKPTLEQCIFAEKRSYSYPSTFVASIANGQLKAGDPPQVLQFASMPVLDNVTTWGSLGAITGPNLHCYRVVIDRTQTLGAGVEWTVEDYDGFSQKAWPPVNVSFLCKDPKYSEGEYLTRVANAMNQHAVGDETF